MTQRGTQLRSVIFDRRVSGLLAKGDLGVFCGVEAALETIRAASKLGVPSFLDFPIAHHAWADRVLTEEAALHPELADTLGHKAPPPKRARLEEEIERADHVIVLTSFHRQTFVDSGVDPSKLVQAPLGVELDLFRPNATSSRDVFRVLFAGQLSQRKGLSYALEGFRQAALPAAELLLLGRIQGAGRPWRRIPQVRQHGPVPYSDLPAQYSRSDVFLLPSLVEGLPQTLLQAMASGLPVIVSENTAGPEIVTDGVNGYVVPIRDPGAIAERLRELHRDRDKREAMGIEARRRAEQFTWEAYGRRIVDAVAKA
jgi:glycosyltransferase involved in cell wall biosynthesis